MANLGIPEHRIAVVEPTEWASATRTCLELLREDGLIEQRYIDAVLDSVRSGSGLYMDLGKGVMLAHTRPENGAKGTGLALVVLSTRVDLNEDPAHPIDQIWGLCAEDTHSHQELMAAFARVLMNEEIRSQISAARTPSDIIALLDQA
ncbi:PTS sugar transporter subunit IIA [Corynebacterium uropygiale]|uniref:Ascorbate-specific PTS system EIIA component n=1 Tax=Corynebacterium uropygiale TaxID=1775911 RepID=A0A9X1TXT0_9CORY|nr:PTS sugar transporter subunit IIA [Corynebacterium uropygiale]MCF4006470.1 PTS sugar transporter subunit IIA [Corynebacterium uropygiale]